MDTAGKTRGSVNMYMGPVHWKYSIGLIGAYPSMWPIYGIFVGHLFPTAYTLC